jgi:hypothetical protein
VKTKFIVQPYGAITQAPGRMPTSLGSGASGGACTGVPGGVRSCSAVVNHDGFDALCGTAQPVPYARVSGTVDRFTELADVPTAGTAAAPARAGDGSVTRTVPSPVTWSSGQIPAAVAAAVRFSAASRRPSI